MTEKKFDVDMDNILKVMSLREGRDMFWRYLNMFEFFSGVYDQDPIKLAMRTGSRNNGVQLWNDLNEACPELVIKMLQENGK